MAKNLSNIILMFINFIILCIFCPIYDMSFLAYFLCTDHNKVVGQNEAKETFHCNFSKYVNGVRLNYAVAALENTMDSITNICLDCGFESQRTFNRVFKDRYKITPREYRKRMEHNNRNGSLRVRR